MNESQTSRFDNLIQARGAGLAIVALLAVCLGAVTVMVGGQAGPIPGLVLLLLLFLAALATPAVVRQGLQAVATFRARFRWFHGLWVVLFLSSLVFRSRDTNRILDAPLDGWAAYRIALVMVIALAAIYRLGASPRDWSRALFRGPVGWMTAFALVSLVSTLWSVYPEWTCYKSLEYLVDLALLALILTEARAMGDFHTLFDCTWLIVILSIVAVWVGVAIAPAQALVRGVGALGIQIRGLIPAVDANGVGDLGAVAALISYRRLLTAGNPHRALHGIVLAVGLGTVVLAQSRSPLIGLLAGMVLVHVLSRRAAWLAAFAGGTAVLLLYTRLGEIVWSYFLRGQTPELFASLSGRTSWWSAAWPAFLESPVAGYGGYAGARFVVLNHLGTNELSSIHNGFFEVLLGTGLLGFVPFLAAIVTIWWLACKFAGTSSAAADRPLIWEAAALLGYTTARSLFTTAFVWHADLVFLQVLGVAEFARRRAAVRSCRRTLVGETYIPFPAAGSAVRSEPSGVGFSPRGTFSPAGPIAN